MHRRLGQLDKKAPVLPVNVDATIIARAIRNDSGHCIIAEAIMQAHPKYKNVAVDLQTIRLTDRELCRRYIYLTPVACQRLLVLFDEGEPIEPFKFTLRGAHITAAQISTPAERQEGRTLHERLGKRRIIPANSPREVPDTIGGKPVLKHRSGRLPHHHINSSKRRFGMRAFTHRDPSQEQPITPKPEPTE